VTTRPVDPPTIAQPADPVSTDVVRAAIFDMDGVVTDTAGVHAEAWRQMFDQVLPVLSGGAGAVMVFDPVDEYRRLVDGRAREDGVRAVLGARGLSLPDGKPTDPPTWRTVHGLANRTAAVRPAVGKGRRSGISFDGHAVEPVARTWDADRPGDSKSQQRLGLDGCWSL
jgi:hypothetical protein